MEALEPAEVVEVAVADDQRVQPGHVEPEQFEVVVQHLRRPAEVEEEAPRLVAPAGREVEREAVLAAEDVLQESGFARALQRVSLVVLDKFARPLTRNPDKRVTGIAFDGTWDWEATTWTTSFLVFDLVAGILTLEIMILIVGKGECIRRLEFRQLILLVWFQENLPAGACGHQGTHQGTRHSESPLE